MIESRIQAGPPSVSLKYPKLRQYVGNNGDDGFIVLFCDPSTGVIVWGQGANKKRIGEYSSMWSPAKFSDLPPGFGLILTQSDV